VCVRLFRSFWWWPRATILGFWAALLLNKKNRQGKSGRLKAFVALLLFRSKQFCFQKSSLLGLWAFVCVPCLCWWLAAGSYSEIARVQKKKRSSQSHTKKTTLLSLKQQTKKLHHLSKGKPVKIPARGLGYFTAT